MRIGLGGHGDPLSTDPFTSLATGDGSILLFLHESGIWDPAPYIADGKTEFQAVVIGAAGGFGGAFGNVARFYYTKSLTHLPNDLWDDWVFFVTKYWERYYGAGYWDYANEGFGWPGTPSPTVGQWLNRNNPGHALERMVATTSVTLDRNGKYSGGAPGGGGMAIATGELADLPEDGVPIVVGAPGAEGAFGQDRANGLWTPNPSLNDGSVIPGIKDDWFLYLGVMTAPGGYLWRMPRIAGWPHSGWPLTLAAYNRLVAWANLFPSSGVPSFGNPGAGADGGYSAFGDLAVASGGKGGAPSKVWGGSAFAVDGSGGEGGIGDSDVAGGGGAGGGGTATAPTPGTDGHYEDGIGAGGGGGHTGQDTTTAGSNGGNGSLEAGPKRYGPKGLPTAEFSVAAVKPGAGGGAQYLGHPHGSRARGFNADGVVVIRVN